MNVITIKQEAIMEIKDAKVFQMIKLCMKCIPMNMMVYVMD